MTSAIFYIILTVMTVLITYISMKTNLLRANVEDQARFNALATAKDTKDPRPPFSLSKSQFAFWTIVIISSFIYTWIRYKFVIPELNTTNLILLGIAATTTAGAKIIDDAQKNNPQRVQDQPSNGFFIDIISDKNGVSIHRLQNVLWTVVMGVIYVHFVGSECRLPDETVISDQMLMLMGISTGAYVGLKATENKL